MTVTLSAEQAASAALIQDAIDQLAAGGGGTLVLPAMDLTFDRGLELRSGIELEGQGEATILRKGSGRVYPLTGYHNYGMCDVPVGNPEGLAPGMTVSVIDDLRRGFYSTLARISYVDGEWVGIAPGINADYLSDANPRLTTAYPLIFGLNVRDVAVRRLHLEGSRESNPAPMDACRGAALYFYQSAGIVVDSVTERDYHGEGLGFQMCRSLRLLNCTFDANTGNGFHPGAGSTDVLFENCRARHNENCGFFFCVRANHITVRGCTFAENVTGMSIGTRDCYNRIEGCTFRENHGPGILAREYPAPCEVHSIRITGCSFDRNGRDTGGAQIRLEPACHDLIIEGCSFVGQLALQAVDGVGRVWFDSPGSDGIDLPHDILLRERPEFVAGCEDTPPEAWRHLPPSAR